jgi:lysozyme
MKHSKDVEQLTEHFEGCELKAYKKDDGIWTIGYGHTRNVTEGMTCTLTQAEFWLGEDYKSAEIDVNMMVHVPLTQHEFDALVDFVFNIGGERFFESTCLRLLNQGNYHGAADEFLKWKFVKGQVMAGLLKRRMAEHDLFEQGVS